MISPPDCVTWEIVEGWSGEDAEQAAMLRMESESIQGEGGDWVPGEPAQAERMWRKWPGNVRKGLHSG